MDLKVEPLKVEEVDDFIKLAWEAFSPLEANMIKPMIFPQGLQPEVLDLLRHWQLNQGKEDIESNCFCAKDSASNEIIGISRWRSNDKPPRDRKELDERFEQARKSRQGGPDNVQMNTALSDAYFKTSFYCEAETMGEVPYITLRMLAVHPNHQRRGVGSVLLKNGLTKADQLGLPVYLDSALMGKSLYERHGFETKSEMPLNCLDYGGRSDGKHWLMVRPAQKPV